MINLIIQPIKSEDDAALAKVIKTSLEELGHAKPGTAYTDELTNTMSKAYTNPRSAYWVAYVDGILVGGCGIKQLDGSGDEYCELQRMFLDSEYRGNGISNQLMDICLSAAKEKGFKFCYLETMSNMLVAQKLYAKYGFKQVEKPMGSTGHFSCDIWMVKEL